MLHTISALVENKPGVLARVSGLFARRAYNIESLAVNRTHDPSISRMTICVEGNGQTLEQMTKQLYKLIEVIKVFDHINDEVVERELAMVKVNCNAANRSEILQICEIFRASVVDAGDKTLIVEATGRPDKLDAMERMLKAFGIRESVRTGRVVLVRGAQET